MCMNTFKNCVECSADKLVIHFKLAAYKNCNILEIYCMKFSQSFFSGIDESFSFINRRDVDLVSYAVTGTGTQS